MYYYDLKQILTTRHGEPSSPRRSFVPLECEWLDENAYITLKDLSSDRRNFIKIDECYVVIGSRAGEKRIKEAEKERLKKEAESAANDF